MGRVRTALVLASVLFSILDRAEHSSGNVTGRIGGSICLPKPLNFSSAVAKVTWKFNRNSSTYQIAKVEEKKLSDIHPQFDNRLEVPGDVTQLYINNLTINDSGTYFARITLENNEVHTVTYNLQVYEPVPVPSLRPEYETGADNTCNVTVYCDVPTNTTSLSYTWKCENNGSDYWEQESTNGTIQLSLQESSEMNVSCTVWNPADNRTASVTLRCPTRQGERERWPISVPLVAVILLLSLSIIYFCKDKLKCWSTKFWKKEEKDEEELKLGVPETDHTVSVQENRSDKEKSFIVPEKTVKYSCNIPIHGEKKEYEELNIPNYDQMDLDD